MAWLQDNQQHIDVALVQETHWKGEGSRDFVSGPWFVVTTGVVASHSKAGLADLEDQSRSVCKRTSKGDLCTCEYTRGRTVLTLLIFTNMFGVRNLTRKATPNAGKVFGENLDSSPPKSPREILWLLGAISTAPLEG